MYHLQNPLWKAHCWLKKKIESFWFKQKSLMRYRNFTANVLYKSKDLPSPNSSKLKQSKLKIQHKPGFFSCLFWLSFWLIYYPQHPAAPSEQSFITLLFSFGHDETFWLLAVLPAVMNMEQAPSPAAKHPPSTLLFALILLLPANWVALVCAWEDGRWPGGKKNNERRLIKSINQSKVSPCARPFLLLTH